MKLDSTESKVLTYVQYHPRKSITSVAKNLKLHQHKVRYIINKALENKILEKRIFVNLSKIGISRFGLYFNLASHKKETRNDIIKDLINAEYTAWLGRFGGDYQYSVNICVNNILSLIRIIEDLKKKYSSFFLDKDFVLRTELEYYGVKYLGYQKNQIKTIFNYHEEEGGENIDNLDHLILKELNFDINFNRQVLSKKFGIPISTLDFRKEKLFKRGIIINEYYELNPSQIGYQSYLFLISTKSFNLDLTKKFKSFCLYHLNIVHLIATLGAWDFELRVDVANAHNAAEIQEEIYDLFGSNIHWVKIMPVLGVLKVSEYPFENLKA